MSKFVITLDIKFAGVSVDTGTSAAEDLDEDENCDSCSNEDELLQAEKENR